MHDPMSPQSDTVSSESFSVLSKRHRLSRVSTTLALLAGTTPSFSRFFLHENSRRKLQHGPAGCCRVFQRGHRRRRDAAGLRRQQTGAARGSDDRPRRAGPTTRQANYPRQRPTGGPRDRRTICPEHESPRTLASASPRLPNSKSPDATRHVHVAGHELSPFCHLARKSAAAIHGYLPTRLIPQKAFDGVTWAEVFHEMDEGTRSPDRANDGVRSIGDRQAAGDREDGHDAGCSALRRDI